MIGTRHDTVAAGSLILALCLTAACNGNPSGTTQRDVETESAFILKVGEGVELAGGELVIHLTEVADDSRCPTDAVCVWQGDAVAALQVVSAGVEHALRLHTNPGKATGPGHADVGAYRIVFLKLAPEPLAGVSIPQGDYRVTLRIEANP